MAVVIDRPQTSVVEVAPMKPSDIVEAWPEEQWCKGGFQIGRKFCALGILLRLMVTNMAVCDYFEVLRDEYGIPLELADQVMFANDEHGKAAAAQVLRDAGF